MSRSASPCADIRDAGLLLERDFEQSDRNPFNWPIHKKWRVTLIACYVTFIVGVNSTSITAVAEEIDHAFGVDDASYSNSYWPVTAWNGGAALAPMVVLPLLEAKGMRAGYLISYALFFVFVVPQAVAQNFATLIATRFFAGCAGGVLQDVMDGIIADVWLGAEQRSLPVTVYVTALLTGVSIGPVFGGAVSSHLDWHWVFYIQLIVYGASLVPVCFWFEETRGLAILAQSTNTSMLRAQNIEGDAAAHKENDSTLLAKFVYDAIILPSYLLCTEPVVFFFTLLSALSYGLLFVGTQSVAQTYAALFGFQEYQTGLVQAAFVVGEGLGFLACLWQNHIFSLKARSSDKPVSSLDTNLAESRLYLTIPGSFVGLAGGLFFYGWTSYSHLSWILPSVGLALVGFGSVLVMQAIMMYVTDAYEKYAGSASAAICFGENMFAAFLPLASQSLYTKLKFHWASALLAFFALALGLAPVMLLIKGQSIRRRSPYMRRAVHGQTGAHMEHFQNAPSIHGMI